MFHDLALVECKKENEYNKTDVYCYEDVKTDEWTRKYSIQHEDIYEAFGEKYNGKNNR